MAAPAFRALPPGVYFNPTAEECVRDYLKPWAAGVPPRTDRVICDVDVYSDSPGALLLGREPGFSRGFDHKWLMLSHCGGGRGKTAAAAAGRGKRVVATGGTWQSEQTPKGVEDEDQQQPHGGRRRSFGFYVGRNGTKRGEKTPWLMEEFTALEQDERGGASADGAFLVFCRIYLTPRLDKEDKGKEKKRLILGDAMVAYDRHGKLKPVRVVVSPELFDAVAQQQGLAPPSPPPPRVLEFQQAEPARRVLAHQQGQPPPPPPPATCVLGYQQVQPGAPPLLRFLGHQHGQAAPTPAVLGDHHGRAMLPRAVPAHHDGQAMLPWGVPAHRHGHAAAHQGFFGYRQGLMAAVQCGTAVQPQLLHVLDPCYNQEASPSVRLVDPQQGEAMTHTEKKPRLAYGSPAPQPQSSDSAASSCVVHVSPCQEQGVVIEIHDDHQCSAEPGAEIPGTAAAGSAEAEPPCYVSAPAPAPAPTELADDAGKAGAVPMLDPGIYLNLTDFEPFVDGVPDFLWHGGGEFKAPYGDDPPPLPGFDEFPLSDLITDLS